jgi:hypothetical protein
VNVYPFTGAEKAGSRNVKRAGELLKVSRAAYYAARGDRPCDRDREDAELAVLITAEHKRSRGRYGAPRIHAELRGKGHRHSRKRVARLMRQRGLRGRTPRRWKKTTIPGPGGRGPGRCDPPGLHHRRVEAQPAVVRRYHLHRDLGGLAVPGHRHRYRLPPGRRVRPGRSPAHGAARRCAGQRGRRA